MDPDWLGDILDRHAPALELFAQQWCDSPEDVVQEAFLKLAGQRPQPLNPAAWLFRVVRNGAMDAGLAARRRKRHETDAGARGPWFIANADHESAGAIDPEEASHALQGLPVEEREVIVAHLWGGLTFQEVAELTATSSSTAHRLYAQGLSTLRERLGVSCRKSRRIPS